MTYIDRDAYHLTAGDVIPLASARARCCRAEVGSHAIARQFADVHEVASLTRARGVSVLDVVVIHDGGRHVQRPDGFPVARRRTGRPGSSHATHGE